MRAFVLRQLLIFVAVVIGTALLLGLLLDLLPNAPSSAEMPAWLRPVALLFGLFTGEFGTAVSQNAAVGGLIAERLVVTLPLALLALVDHQGPGTWAGIAGDARSACRPSRWRSRPGAGGRAAILAGHGVAAGRWRWA